MTGAPVRVDVVGGGRPDADTLAVIERAVGLVLARRRAAAAAGTPSTPAWRRAALREGVGGPRAVRPDRRG